MGELVLGMIGLVRCAVVLVMTRPAIGRRAGVLTVNVALRAIHVHMGAGQGEVREIVIKSGWLPSGRRVALRAVMSEVAVCVIGIVRFIVLLFMTGPAISRRAAPLPAGVALGAVHANMGAGEREVGEIVVKLRRLPSGCGVAFGAGM